MNRAADNCSSRDVIIVFTPYRLLSARVDSACPGASSTSTRIRSVTDRSGSVMK